LTMSIAELHQEYPRADAQNFGGTMKNGGVEATPPFPPRFAPGVSTVPTDQMRRPIRITGELQAARMVRAVRSERQLQEVMVDFWANHFNVFVAKGELRWYTTAWEREVIHPHALGRFPELLR